MYVCMYGATNSLGVPQSFEDKEHISLYPNEHEYVLFSGLTS